MRAALLLVAFAAGVFATPVALQTAGNPKNFNIEHDRVEAGYNSSSALWTMFKQCDGVRARGTLWEGGSWWARVARVAVPLALVFLHPRKPAQACVTAKILHFSD